MLIPVTGSTSTSELYPTHMTLTADRQIKDVPRAADIIVGDDSYVSVMKEVPINMGPILNGYCAACVF